MIVGRIRRARAGGKAHVARHGMCEHQEQRSTVGVISCVRCGAVRKGRWWGREQRCETRRERYGGGRGRPYGGVEKLTPECVPKPLRRSLLQRLKGLFTAKGKRP
jgi:hypothetical protein